MNASLSPETRDSAAWTRAGVPDRCLKLDAHSALTELGEGAAGAVERAWDREGAVYVAVKRSGKHLAHVAQREHAVLAQLDHPNVLRALGFGRRDRDTAKDRGYLVTELVSGRTLVDASLAAAPRAILLGLASGLAHVHRQGFFHNDLHDENVMVSGERAVIIDFGHASRVDRGHGDATTLMDLLQAYARSSGSSDPELAADARKFSASALALLWRAGTPPTEAQLRSQPLFARPDVPAPDMGPPCKRHRRA